MRSIDSALLIDQLSTTQSMKQLCDRSPLRMHGVIEGLEPASPFTTNKAQLVLPLTSASKQAKIRVISFES